MRSSIGIIPADWRKQRWDEIEQMLLRAIEYNRNEWSVSDIEDGLDEEDYILWGELLNGRLRSIAVVNMLHFPRKKILNLMLVVSEDKEFGEPIFLEQMEEFAKVNDCDGIRLYGRQGWIRTLAKYGYEIPYYILEKVI